MLRRFLPQLNVLEDRTVPSSVSDSGGKGGATKTLELPGSLNLVHFSWKNYSIPDEF